MNEKEMDTLVVFTARSPERVVREGGSQAWVLNPARAKLCKWLVCTQNRHNPDHEFSDATEAHGSGFLIGKISGITLSAEERDKPRWLVKISKFARVDYPGLWDHGRNPVRYASLDELGISLNGLDFQSMPEFSESPPESPQRSTTQPMLTISEAKVALAAAFGVKPDAVEITIRG